MPRHRKWIKAFVFQEHERSTMTLQGVTLHPTRERLEIAPVNGAYPTSTYLVARTRVTNPSACRKWAGFFALTKTTRDPAGVPITNVRYKLNDGNGDLFWNDADPSGWLPAGQSDWNTEQEIADHVATWPSQSLGVVIGLTTTNPVATPIVHEVRLLYDTDLVALEDYVVRSFADELSARVRPISILAVHSTGQTEIDLKLLRTPYTVTAIDAIYNNATDPQHMRPLVGWAFDVAQKLLSLPAQPSGHELEVRFVWRPEVVFMQSQDFTEIARIPAIVVDHVDVGNKRTVRERPYVINKGSGAGFAFEEGFQADITVPLRFITASKRDLHVLHEEVSRFFANNKLLRSQGQDEFYPISADTNSYRDDSVPTQRELYSAGLQAKILNAVFYSEDARPITGVLGFSVSGGPNIDVR